MDGRIAMDRERPMKPDVNEPAVNERSVLRPAVLLVEDDPTSAAFMAAALEALPLALETAGSCAAALAAAAASGHALWLVDAHLPDGDGPALLAQLRALRPGVPALAHTAAREPALHRALLAAGFVEVLVKPLAASALREAVARRLAAVPDTATARTCGVRDEGLPGPRLPPWDDAVALAALNGERMHVETLRGLFIAELPTARAAVVAAAEAGDHPALAAALHRLAASCGFVGAVELSAAVAGLRAQPDSAEALARFELAIARLHHAA
jgi:CheY-like chemotaxis protein/HPt (histidine-containing phosphotransfer) domain-containing protein